MEGNKVTYVVIGLLVLGVAGYFLLTGSSNMDNRTGELEADLPVNGNMVKDDAAMEEDKMEKDESMMDKTIVDVAVEAGNFSTLVTAVTEAGLVETLSGEGPFTVFAPTDEAFAKIPEETLTAILADKEQLTSILTYHVVPGKVMAADVVELTSATTVQGQDLTIEVTEDGTVMVDDAKVITTDIETSNGVIHVIDTVVLPQ